MNDIAITVFTPTYNRANCLKRLYASLIKQNNPYIEWLIVDDGSVDDTEEMIKGFIAENRIAIRYFYQKNMGKAVAFNNGVKRAKGNLFLCVDSDDFLANNAIDKILVCGDKIKGRDVAGIVALKKDIDGIMLCDTFPCELLYESTFDLSEIYSIGGEWTIIYKTKILKSFSFPIINGERFIGECVVYDQIAQKYKMFLLNEVITVCEYQSDGLTRNIVDIMLKNPTGYKIFYMQRIDMAYTLKKRIGYIVRYNTFKRLSKDKNYRYTGKYIGLVNLFSCVGIVGKMYYRMVSRCNNRM